MMYRHLHFNEHAEASPRRDNECFDCDIKAHHLVASTDDFSGVAMHWDVMMAAKLNYIHDFPGILYICTYNLYLEGYAYTTFQVSTLYLYMYL
jgi:hypothetical protein